MVSSRSRCYAITYNNYTEDCLERLKIEPRLSYCVFGKEIGKECSTPHLQGYVQFKEKIAFSTVCSLLNNKAHIEPAIASDASNYDYCTKDDNLFFEYGTRKKQGKRNDIHSACQMIQEGHSMKEVALSNPVPYVKYHRGFEKYKSLMIEPRNEMPEVIVLYGLTGTGKSRTARQMLPDAYVWGPEQGKWFDGYEGQEECIFEEFRGQLPFGMLLRLLDRYDCRVETKGSTIQFVATKIVITSPVHPNYWYQMFESSDDKIDQLLRRVKEVKELKC